MTRATASAPLPGQRRYAGRIVLLAVLAIGLVLAWWAVWQDRPARDVAEARVRVVSAPADDRVVVRPLDAAAPAIPVATAIPDFAHLTVNERAELFDRRPRDPVWSAKAEAVLEARLRASDVVPGAIRCADTLCSVQGTIPTASSADRDRIVDGLVRGRLHPAYDRAGLVPMQAISIDADDAGTLGFTEYVRRK